MTREEAHELLRRAEAGEDVSEEQIIAALRATGDLQSDFDVREARRRMQARFRLHVLNTPPDKLEADPLLVERRSHRKAGTWEKRAAASILAPATWLDALH